MSCSEFTVWVVSDNLADRQRAVEHAAKCPGCARVLSGHQALQDRVSFWRGQVEAPDHLEDRIRQAVAEVPEEAAPRMIERVRSESGPKFRTRLWLALAASFLVGIGLGFLELPARSEGPQETRNLLAGAELKIAEAEERSQVRAIFQLETRVDRILARAGESELATHEAARLMEYRTRIANLDVTIDDVRGFVEQNPGHPRARSLLMEAYKEKKEILREVLALEERSS